MENYQRGIINPISPFSTYLEFDPSSGSKIEVVAILKKIAAIVDGDQIVMGIGAPIIDIFAADIPGIRSFNALDDPDGTEIAAATQTGLFLQIRGETYENTLEKTQAVLQQTQGAFNLIRRDSAFKFAGGRDLTGYEDGTENPKGDKVYNVACVQSDRSELDGSSFLSLQKWVHDLNYFRRQSPRVQDEIFGRRIADNAEMDDAPDAAHVKRTEQENFSPEAFLLRRSMAWSDGDNEGLMFTAFGASLLPFDVQMQRMVGMEDGIVDNLFKFSTAVTGAFYWCPPMHDQQVNLSALGL